jgi:hypothetical protein
VTVKPQTLGDYRDIFAALAGEGSRAVKFIDDKIQQSPKGRNDKVIVDESQMMFLFASLIKEDPQ